MSIRELPKIDFAGTLFYIDLRLNEFREVNNFMNRIDIDSLYETDQGFKCWYDPTSKNIFQGSEGEFVHRQKDLQLLQLPALDKMDPVGFTEYVDRWVESNPIMNALINHVVEVQKSQSLLQKNRVNPNKGLRL